jgi:anthranilate/para-aminobenzoate synthase component II
VRLTTRRTFGPIVPASRGVSADFMPSRKAVPVVGLDLGHWSLAVAIAAWLEPSGDVVIVADRHAVGTSGVMMLRSLPTQLHRTTLTVSVERAAFNVPAGAAASVASQIEADGHRVLAIGMRPAARIGAIRAALVHPESDVTPCERSRGIIRP